MPFDGPSEPVSRAALVAAALLLLVPHLTDAQSIPDEREVLRPGDVVVVQVWRQPEFSGEFPVTSNGVIAHPLYREISAAGRSVGEVEDDLRTFLRSFEDAPNFVVEARFRVAVGGEVRQPDVHLLPRGTTVAEAVAMTGGISERGNLQQVLLRRGPQEYRLDLTDPQRRYRDVTVRSGDEIVVHRRRNVVREYVLPTVGVMGSLASIARLVLR